MREPYTKITFTSHRAGEKLAQYIDTEFTGKCGLAVCDENTRVYAEKIYGVHKVITYNSDVCATPEEAEVLKIYAKSIPEKIDFLIACGSGTIHDITRYAAYDMNIPFISYPTAASVDGFVSNVAAMTIGGRKVTTPACPPVALFADPDVYCAAPRRLTLSGVGDILGKYVSIADWKITNAINNEPLDDSIISLEENAVAKILSLNPSDAAFTEAVMDGLVMSGMAIQYHGSSRPASGAEHHLSHLWEMHCINAPTDALHGEKVGVSALHVIKRYKEAAELDFAGMYTDVDYSSQHLMPVYGSLTEGIADENTPNPTDKITCSSLYRAEKKIRAVIGALPDETMLVAYMKKIGAKTTMRELELPNDREFMETSLKFAPYVRRRITFLKLLNNFPNKGNK